MQNNNSAPFRANRIFVDRIEPTSLVNSTCKDILDGKSDKKVFVFYGYGGIGKSKFLEELSNRLEYKDSFDFIKINLNMYEYNNIMSILLAIRRSLDIDCSEFDYATVQYYNKCKLPLSQLNEQYKTSKSTVIDIVKTCSKDCADLIVPGFSYLEKVASLFPKIKDFFKRIKDEKEYKRIDELDATTLLTQLPIYLANGINDYDKKILLIFDDYESMRNKLNGGSLCSSCDDWILNFLRNIEQGVFIFSSREKFDWSPAKTWGLPLEQYYLERLSEKDAYSFLKNVPIDNEDYIEDILNIAQGIPIYLDMCVDLYENHLKRGVGDFDLSNIDTESITNRYLAHLSPSQSELVHIISRFEIFDLELLQFIIREINLAIDELELKKLLEKCIFEKLDSQDYKLDASIKKQLNILSEVNISETCIKLLLRYLSKNTAVCLNNALSYFDTLCQLFAKRVTQTSKKEDEQFFVCINNILDAGYWTSAEAITAKYLSSEEYRLFALYVRAQKEKREGNLQDALILTEELMNNSKMFGNYRFSINLLHTKITHLLGNYKEAKKGYADIVDKMELFDLEEKDKTTYIIAKLKLADLNFLNGNFIASKKNLKDIKFDGDKNLEMEYLRIKAHIHRFNLDFDNAKELYEKCYEDIYSDRKARGMLLNNLCEIYCNRQPELAIDYGKKSLEENGFLNANIEVGKTYSALSVAYSRLKDFKSALFYANQSISLQSRIGYKSGVLFGYFALCYCYYSQNQYEQYNNALGTMKEIFNQIGTYPYVVKYAEYLYSRQWTEDDIQWLDSDSMQERVKDLL